MDFRQLLEDEDPDEILDSFDSELDSRGCPFEINLVPFILRNGHNLKRIRPHLITPLLAILAVQHHPLALRYVPGDVQDEAICLTAVEMNGLALRFVRKQTREICLAAVLENGLAVKYVKGKHRLLSLLAVRQNGLALRFIESQDEEICLAAVIQDGRAWKFVKHRTEMIDLAAVKHDGANLMFFKLQTPALCLAAVKQCGQALSYVKNKTHEICRAAVIQDGRAIDYVPEQTEELICLAIGSHPGAIHCVREATFGHWFRASQVKGIMINELPRLDKLPDFPASSSEAILRQFYDNVFHSNPSQLKHIPMRIMPEQTPAGSTRRDVLYWTEENGKWYNKLCEEGAILSGNILQDMTYPDPEDWPHFPSDLVYLGYLSHYGADLGRIPKHRRNDMICLAGVRRHGLNLKHVPHPLSDCRDICLEAVRSDGLALQYVPGVHLDEEICMTALKENGLAIRFIPEEKMTDQYGWAAVEQNGLALHFIREQTPLLCVRAVFNNVEAIRAVRLPDKGLRQELREFAKQQFYDPDASESEFLRNIRRKRTAQVLHDLNQKKFSDEGMEDDLSYFSGLAQLNYNIWFRELLSGLI